MKGPPLPPPQHRTVNEALAAAAATPSGITFVDLHERETFVPFREVHARARRTAAALRHAGVAAGDRVALVFPTSPAFLDAYFGTLLAGAVPVPLYPPFRLGRLPEYHAATARMFDAAGASLVLADARTRKLLGQAIERSRPRLGCRSLEDLSVEADGELHAAVDPEALGLIQFSSGSTTDPKPVALSHAALMAQLSALKALLPPEDRFPQRGVSWLPLYHDMGLIGCLLLAVYYPGPLVLIPPEHFLARPALWLRAIARHRATLSVSPTFGYAICSKRARDEDLEGLDLSSWSLAVCGAEPISIATLRGFAQRFGRFGFDASALRPVYGLAEASLAVTFAPPGQPRAIGVDPARLAATGEVIEGARAIVSVGTPVPGSELEVRGTNGENVPERTVGRIFARGPSVMVGYFGRPEATAEAIADGWLDTGDLGFVADGELYVCGREKDLVIIRGANHVAHEFEECLDGVEGVRAACSVALGFVPDGEDGEELLVLAERARDANRSDGDAGTAELIRQAILEHTGIRPHTVVMLEPGTLPRTSSGKLRRSEALRLYLAGQLTPPRSAGPARLSAELARSALAFAKVKLGRGR
ncbi:MAG: fatty acyl-AMP ligase [Thermoanaerobaculaceae bacterium]|nr:fatty acyl-AMP ligase [Thermoanaerobaculaceae bacterium]